MALVRILIGFFYAGTSVVLYRRESKSCGAVTTLIPTREDLGIGIRNKTSGIAAKEGTISTLAILAVVVLSLNLPSALAAKKTPWMGFNGDYINS